MIIFSQVSIDILFLHSRVKAALCGERTILSNLNSGLLVSGGSVSYTSIPAPCIILFFKAQNKSLSLIIPPLEVLIMMEDVLRNFKLFLLMRFFVLLFNGTWILTMSETFNNSFIDFLITLYFYNQQLEHLFLKEDIFF